MLYSWRTASWRCSVLSFWKHTRPIPGDLNSGAERCDFWSGLDGFVEMRFSLTFDIDFGICPLLVIVYHCSLMCLCLWLWQVHFLFALLSTAEHINLCWLTRTEMTGCSVCCGTWQPRLLRLATTRLVSTPIRDMVFPRGEIGTIQTQLAIDNALWLAQNGLLRGRTIHPKWSNCHLG